MANLIAYDRALALANANDTYWTGLGAHTTAKKSPTLAAYLRERWWPWWAKVMQLAAHPLDDTQQAIAATNIADQLVALRDDAAYRYFLPVLDNGPQDDELIAIADEARWTYEALAANAIADHFAPRTVQARRGHPESRSRAAR